MIRSAIKFSGATTAMVLMNGAAHSAPPKWVIDAAQSSIAFSGTHAGKPFTGKFRSWRGDVLFDPKDLEHSAIIIQIDTSSAATGDALQEKTLAGEEWFGSDRVKLARFSSRSIRTSGSDRYIVEGVLQIKGRSVPISLPFNLSINAKTANASGKLTLDRAAFDLGMKSDPKANWVSRNIVVTFALKASR